MSEAEGAIEPRSAGIVVNPDIGSSGTASDSMAFGLLF